MAIKLSYGKQWISKDDIKAVKSVLKSDMLTQGDFVPLFEKTLAAYTGAKYAVAVSSGTAALHIAYLALGLTNGDEVVTSPITFAATANAALYCGAKPVFADISLDTGLIDVKQIEKKITDKTKILAPVHYAGSVADMPAIAELAKKHNLFVVEDACHALGSLYDEFSSGACDYSDMAILSFHPVKHITTGEGGAILTNNTELYKKLLLLRSHGITRDNFELEPSSPCYNEMQMLGFNYRITDFQAALGLSQLNSIEDFIFRRRDIANFYGAVFSKINSITPLVVPENVYSSYHLYPVLFESKEVRDNVYYKLREMDITCQIHYMPVYMHPYYRKNGYAKTKCKNAEDFYSRMLSLPMYPRMKDKELKYVVKCIKKALPDGAK